MNTCSEGEGDDGPSAGGGEPIEGMYDGPPKGLLEVEEEGYKHQASDPSSVKAQHSS